VGGAELLRRSRSFKVTKVDISGRPVCDFLLLINTDILSRTVSKLLQIIVQIWTLCVFEPPFGEGSIGATYTIHLTLTGKLVMDLILVLMELFARCYDSVVTSENRLKIGVVQGVGELKSNFRVEENVPHQSFLWRTWVLLNWWPKGAVHSLVRRSRPRRRREPITALNKPNILFSTCIGTRLRSCLRWWWTTYSVVTAPVHNYVLCVIKWVYLHVSLDLNTTRRWTSPHIVSRHSAKRYQATNNNNNDKNNRGEQKGRGAS